MLPSILKNRKCESHPTHVRSSTLGRAVVVDTRRSRSNTTTNSHFSADAACLISPLNPRLVFQIHHISSKAFFILQPPPSTTTEYAAYLTCHNHYLYSAPLSLFPLSPPPPVSSYRQTFTFPHSILFCTFCPQLFRALVATLQFSIPHKTPTLLSTPTSRLYFKPIFTLQLLMPTCREA